MFAVTDAYLGLLGLIALLFFLPKVLVRVGVPSPVTEMAMGVVAGPLVLAWIEVDELLTTLAALGISALFLFAGLEVSVREMAERRSTLLIHVGLQLLLLAAAVWAALQYDLSLPVAVLAGAAIMSSSAAFIIPALDALGFPEEQNSWIKQKAIANELLAILAVLLFSNSAEPRDLAIGILGIGALVAIVPLLFRGFHHTILRWAPNTEFSFVMIVALLAAYGTHELGVHYLVGAFLVGAIARRYLRWSAAQGVETASVRSALQSFRFFSAFLMPFFFFVAGLTLPEGALSQRALIAAGVLLATAVPLRVATVMLHRRLRLGEEWHESWNVGLLIAPTTVFSVAMAEILHLRFGAPTWIVGGLILYGAASSFLPLLTRKVRSAEYEDLLPVGDFTILSGAGLAGAHVRAALESGKQDAHETAERLADPADETTEPDRGT